VPSPGTLADSVVIVYVGSLAVACLHDAEGVAAATTSDNAPRQMRARAMTFGLPARRMYVLHDLLQAPMLGVRALSGIREVLLFASRSREPRRDPRSYYAVRVLAGDAGLPVSTIRPRGRNAHKDRHRLSLLLRVWAIRLSGLPRVVPEPIRAGIGRLLVNHRPRLLFVAEFRPESGGEGSAILPAALRLANARVTQRTGTPKRAWVPSNQVAGLALVAEREVIFHPAGMVAESLSSSGPSSCCNASSCRTSGVALQTDPGAIQLC